MAVYDDPRRTPDDYIRDERTRDADPGSAARWTANLTLLAAALLILFILFGGMWPTTPPTPHTAPPMAQPK